VAVLRVPFARIEETRGELMKIECAAALLAILALSGCQTAAEQAAEAARERAVAIGRAQETCASFGHKPETPEHSSCVERMFYEVAYAQERDAVRTIAAQQAFRQNLSNNFNQITANMKPTYQSGGFVNCNRLGYSTNCYWH
jgi:antirestriction protein ArdC